MPSAEQDRWARGVLRAAYVARGLPTPTRAELQASQAVARFEGGYGLGWPSSVQPPPHNWGAIQCGHTAPCGAGCFEHGDSHADGSSYRGCFRRYPTPVDGAADLLRELYRRPGVPEAMRAGDPAAIARAMRVSGYFEAPASRYADAIDRNAQAVASSLGEPLAVGVSAPSSRGSGPAWWAWGAAAAALVAAWRWSR
jgi:hypothetical protein